MSTLKLLQTCPTQHKNLFSSLGALYPKNPNTITFNVENFKPILSHQLTFKIKTKVIGRNIHHTVLDEGASTSVISMSCWRATGSLKVNHSPTTLKYFYGRGFQPYGLLPVLSIDLGGNFIFILVEVVEASLDYNLLLGRNFFYTMMMIASLVFCFLYFPE